jgi:hypothetical protein
MQIGLARLWINGPRQVIAHLWKVIWLHDGARNNLRLPDPVQRQNLELWLKECVKHYG